MKLKDMTIEQLRKYEEIKTARPRKDMILVRDLRKWAKAKVEQALDAHYIEKQAIALWIKRNFNLEDKV